MYCYYHLVIHRHAVIMPWIFGLYYVCLGHTAEYFEPEIELMPV